MLISFLEANPADRILVATARQLGASLVTADRGLLQLAKSGHLAAMNAAVQGRALDIKGSSLLTAQTAVIQDSNLRGKVCDQKGNDYQQRCHENDERLAWTVVSPLKTLQ
jgi:hypothetical protein